MGKHKATYCKCVAGMLEFYELDDELFPLPLFTLDLTQTDYFLFLYLKKDSLEKQLAPKMKSLLKQTPDKTQLAKRSTKCMEHKKTKLRNKTLFFLCRKNLYFINKIMKLLTHPLFFPKEFQYQNLLLGFEKAVIILFC